MKKICITTFHNAHNYGAVLQVFALSKILQEQNKYSIKILNYNNKNITRGYKLFTPFRKNIIQWCKHIFYDLKNYNKNKARYDSFKHFINTNLNLTIKYENEKKIKLNPPNADIYITGSDQVWNMRIVGGLSDIYTLNFGNASIKRISYGASVGESNLILDNSNLYKEKLSNIDYISVREESSKKILNQIMAKQIDVVLDPTLLFTDTQWEKELKEFNTISEDYICAYVVQPDKEYIKIVNDLSIKTGLKIIHFGLNNPGYKNVLKSAYKEGPLEFINYIKNAKYIVATSFHATVFSVLFHKDFFIIPNKKTGERVIDLLNKLNITGRTFVSYNDFYNIDYNLKTNWDIVDEKLEYERNKSLEWLINAIEG